MSSPEKIAGYYCIPESYDASGSPSTLRCAPQKMPIADSLSAQQTAPSSFFTIKTSTSTLEKTATSATPAASILHGALWAALNGNFSWQKKTVIDVADNTRSSSERVRFGFMTMSAAFEKNDLGSKSLDFRARLLGLMRGASSSRGPYNGFGGALAGFEHIAPSSSHSTPANIAPKVTVKTYSPSMGILNVGEGLEVRLTPEKIAMLKTQTVAQVKAFFTSLKLSEMDANKFTLMIKNPAMAAGIGMGAFGLSAILSGVFHYFGWSNPHSLTDQIAVNTMVVGASEMAVGLAFKGGFVSLLQGIPAALSSSVPYFAGAYASNAAISKVEKMADMELPWYARLPVQVAGTVVAGRGLMALGGALAGAVPVAGQALARLNPIVGAGMVGVTVGSFIQKGLEKTEWYADYWKFDGEMEIATAEKERLARESHLACLKRMRIKLEAGGSLNAKEREFLASITNRNSKQAKPIQTASAN